MIVIAHAADLLTGLIFLAPMVIVIGILVAINIRDRRRGETRAPLPTNEGDEPG